MNNVEALAKLFGQIKSDEFTELLYSLFEAHGKVKDLFTCAIALELANIRNLILFLFVNILSRIRQHFQVLGQLHPPQAYVAFDPQRFWS